MSSNEQQQGDIPETSKPDWNRLEAELYSEGPAEAEILGSYETPSRDVLSSADAAIDVEAAQQKVDKAFETDDKDVLEGHPDARELNLIGLNAELDSYDDYNDETTDSMIDLMRGLSPGQSAEVMRFPSSIPEGFASSDGLKQLALFFDKAGIEKIHLPKVGARDVQVTPDGKFVVTISMDKEPSGLEVVSVTVECVQGVDTGKQ